MTRRRGIVLAIFVAMLLGAPERAWGGDAATNQSIREAADHFERGVKLYEEQDWRSALIEFERAYSIAPRYTVLYNIGQCRYQLQDYAGSLEAFEKYLKAGQTLGSADAQQRVTATIDDLRGRVARVLVTTDVDGAEITVDDAVVGRTPLSSPLVVSEGRRKIGASKAGYATAARNIDVAGKDSTEVALHLEPLAPPPVPLAIPRPSRGGRSAVATVAIFGLATAGVAVGTVFGVIAVGNKNDLELECPNNGCPPSAASKIDTLKRNAVISTLGFSVGAAGVLAGLGYVLLVPGRSEPGSVHPFIGPGVAGASGSFW